MRNRNLWKKLGLTAATAATFGLVSSGVFLSVNSIAATSSAAPTVIEAASETTAGQDAGTMKNTVIGNEDVASDMEAGVNETAVTQSDTVEETNTIADTTVSDKKLSVSEVAANAMPAMVAITNTSVQDMREYFGGSGDYNSIFGDLFGNGYGSMFGNGYGSYSGGMYGSSYGGSFGGGQNAQSVSMGTGVIIGETDEKLIIVTNQHVIDSADELSVGFIDESTATASVLGEDASSDLAVIAVNKADLSADTLSAIKVISIGSSDSLTVGEEVVAIGNALGYGQSVSTGIVSAMHRVLMASDGSTEGTEDGLIQTDAAINPGNSGGALLNMKGELIGINSAKYADTDVEGMGYAIPITSALPILESLQNGSAAAGDSQTISNAVRLGISCVGITEEYSSYYGVPVGVYVDEVDEGSAAANAGIQSGDIITAIDGVTVSSVEELSNALSKYKPGDSASVTVSREVSYSDIFAQRGRGTEYKSGTTTVTFGLGEAQRTSSNETE